MQITVRNSIRISGIGLHSGKKSRIIIHPAKENAGISFLKDGVKIPALSAFVSDTKLCTTLSRNDKQIKTVEHLMAALTACQIDNCLIEVLDEEIPILDGSAMPFIMLIRETGIRFQDSPKKILKITKPVEVWQDDKIAMILPDTKTTYTCKINFQHSLIGEQEFTIDSYANFEQEISRSRTFGFLKDIDALRSKGLVLGGSVDNAIVLDEHDAINDLRYSDEFVRHKILDAVGDLRLLGGIFVGKFYSYKGGHELNNLLCKEVLRKNAFEILEVRYDRRKPVEDLLCTFA